MVGIYMFTNKIDHKSYIGQSRDIQRRYKEHKTKETENTVFHDAIKYYGFDNFDFEILEECDVSELNDKEIFYIEKLKTYEPYGYNQTHGGSFPHTNKLSSIHDVEKIIELLANTKLSNTEIGNLFNVSDQTISDINTGRTWHDNKYVYPIRKIEHKNIVCSNCGNRITIYSKSGLCKKCSQLSKSNIPSKEKLYSLLSKYSFVKVAKMFKVSDRTIRNWCQKYQIPDKSNYYKNIMLA